VNVFVLQCVEARICFVVVMANQLRVVSLLVLGFVFSNAETDHKWEAYKQEFSKRYASAEEEKERHGIFHESLKRIDALNLRNGDSVFGLNPTSDRRPEEKWAKGGKAPQVQSAPVMEVSSPRNPAAIDWRLSPAVTPVKNQGQCGSCWAFSVAETVESAYILKTGETYGMTFSPQQVASCTTTCDGCGGGWTYAGYEYLKSVPGLSSAWFWPYAQSLTPPGCLGPSCTQACSAHNVSQLTPDQFYIGHYATVSGYSYATPPCTGACATQDLTKLAAAVEQGPVSICVNAGAWSDYKGGVLTAEGCGSMASSSIDHCVQLIGYNTTAAKPYWIVRNSWDTVFGEDGYIYLEYGKNTCGLADVATVPELSNAARTDSFEHMYSLATGNSVSGPKIVV